MLTNPTTVQDQQTMSHREQKELREYKQMVDRINEWSAVLDHAIKQRNIITESEFSRFLPLYQNKNIDPSNPEDRERLVELQQLSKDFFDRVNPYEEITVVDNFDHTKVIAVFPKIYMKFNTIKSESAISEFDIKTNVPFRKDLHEQGLNALLGAIAESQDVTFNPDIKVEERRKYLEREKELLSPTRSTEEVNQLNNTIPSNNTDGVSVCWEYDDE